MATLFSWKPKQVTKKILSPLQDRAYDVIVSRFGLGTDAERKTLEAIGQIYNITRERVRQIENAALATIRKSQEYKEHDHVFQELRDRMKELGAVIAEEELLSHLAKDKNTQNHIYFYLVLGDDFMRHKEDDHFKARWTIDSELTDQIHSTLHSIYESMSDEDLVAEPELVSRFLSEMKDVAEEYRNEEIAKRWLNISKKIDKNPLGEWGKADSGNVKTRGIKDYAFLMMRKHGNPMHFREVADAICKTFGKKTHVATCHNELIKDSRFVLVGRGVYALAEWGYKPGVVRDVIKEILKKNGPLTKE
ncbi:MAG TPA: sigma factor-like helix-turn-helix DNA-binding protein, partial [Blastocatellia bacterium]|nr:sigma factor-like helix-turn-helix DNA-binding protein [Blastocatellia bacterium]